MRKFGVSNGELPTLVLLEDGKEYIRFPSKELGRKGATTSFSYQEKELMRYFDLDKRYMATKSVVGAEKKRGAT